MSFLRKSSEVDLCSCEMGVLYASYLTDANKKYLERSSYSETINRPDPRGFPHILLEHINSMPFSQDIATVNCAELD
jgi:hypothetical protein